MPVWAQILIALVGAIPIGVIVAHLSAPGADKLKFRGKNREDVLVHMQARQDEMAGQIHTLTLQQKRSHLNEEANKEYRHAQANRQQALVGLCEVQQALIIDVLAYAKDVPDYIKKRAAELKTPAAILGAIPLPEPKVWTLKEVEAMDEMDVV